MVDHGTPFHQDMIFHLPIKRTVEIAVTKVAESSCAFQEEDVKRSTLRLNCH
jgi:hypothetical protein